MSNVVPVKKKRWRRSDWEEAQIEIARFTKQFCAAKQRMPTKMEIAAGTGYSEKTIRRHLSATTRSRVASRHKIFSEDVISAITVNAMKGDVPSQKLYLEYVMGWDKNQVESTMSPQAYAAEVRNSQRSAFEATLNKTNEVKNDTTVDTDQGS